MPITCRQASFAIHNFLSIARKSVREQDKVILLAPHSERQGQAFLQKPKHLLVVYFCPQILKAFKSPLKRVLLSTLGDHS